MKQLQTPQSAAPYKDTNVAVSPALAGELERMMHIAQRRGFKTPLRARGQVVAAADLTVHKMREYFGFMPYHVAQYVVHTTRQVAAGAGVKMVELLFAPVPVLRTQGGGQDVLFAAALGNGGIMERKSTTTHLELNYAGVSAAAAMGAGDVSTIFQDRTSAHFGLCIRLPRKGDIHDPDVQLDDVPPVSAAPQTFTAASGMGGGAGGPKVPESKTQTAVMKVILPQPLEQTGAFTAAPAPVVEKLAAVYTAAPPAVQQQVVAVAQQIATVQTQTVRPDIRPVEVAQPIAPAVRTLVAKLETLPQPVQEALQPTMRETVQKAVETQKFVQTVQAVTQIVEAPVQDMPQAIAPTLAAVQEVRIIARAIQVEASARDMPVAQIVAEKVTVADPKTQPLVTRAEAALAASVAPVTAPAVAVEAPLQVPVAANTNAPTPSALPRSEFDVRPWDTAPARNPFDGPNVDVWGRRTDAAWSAAAPDVARQPVATGGKVYETGGWTAPSVPSALWQDFRVGAQPVEKSVEARETKSNPTVKKEPVPTTPCGKAVCDCFQKATEAREKAAKAAPATQATQTAAPVMKHGI